MTGEAAGEGEAGGVSGRGAEVAVKEGAGRDAAGARAERGGARKATGGKRAPDTGSPTVLTLPARRRIDTASTGESRRLRPRKAASAAVLRKGKAGRPPPPAAPHRKQDAPTGITA